MISGVYSNHVQLLPPQYQEARERKAIKDDPRLQELLRNEAVLDIRKVEGGYVVVTESRELQVDIRYIRQHVCGPKQFELEFHTPAARSSGGLQALPPQYQEARERNAIMNDPRLQEYLGNAAILEIRKVEGGYLVITGSKQMQVDVHYIPLEDHICGPARFELNFHRPTPR